MIFVTKANAVTDLLSSPTFCNLTPVCKISIQHLFRVCKLPARHVRWKNRSDIDIAPFRFQRRVIERQEIIGESVIMGNHRVIMDFYMRGNDYRWLKKNTVKVIGNA